MVKSIKSYVIGNSILYCGDMKDVVPNICKVHSVITDPPYHLQSVVERYGKKGSAPVKNNDVYMRQSKGFMGLEWDGGDVSFKKETWEILKGKMFPGSYLLSFGGSRTFHRIACAIENAGFDIRDTITWVYGQGFPKSHNLGDGVGTALKPAIEFITLARNQIEGTNRQNIERYASGGLNIDACRIGNEGGVKDYKKDGNSIKSNNVYGVYGACVTKKIDKGRWPSNLIHDGSDEIIKLFPKNSSKFFYCAKASTSEKMKGLEEKNIHPTVKPMDLMQYLCRLVTPKNGIVLDPFMGSGTTGVASIKEGFRFIGIEQNEEYFDIAYKRIKAEVEKKEDNM